MCYYNFKQSDEAIFERFIASFLANKQVVALSGLSIKPRYGNHMFHLCAYALETAPLNLLRDNRRYIITYHVLTMLKESLRYVRCVGAAMLPVFGLTRGSRDGTGNGQRLGLLTPDSLGIEWAVRRRIPRVYRDNRPLLANRLIKPSEVSVSET